VLTLIENDSALPLHRAFDEVSSNAVRILGSQLSQAASLEAASSVFIGSVVPQGKSSTTDNAHTPTALPRASVDLPELVSSSQPSLAPSTLSSWVTVPHSSDLHEELFANLGGGEELFAWQ
jgi:hypothetical protein